MRQCRPVVLGPRSRLAVTCPASPAPDGTIERGCRRLRALGIETVTGPSCARRGGIWAGTDEERAGELLSFLLDPSIDGVIAGRGGVGCLRLLPLLEGFPPCAPAKWIIGRSDLSALHLYFYKRRGWVGLSGPMVSTDLGTELPAETANRGAADVVVERTLGLLRSPDPPGVVDAPGLTTLTGGTAEGPLFPVNLSLLASMTGMPYLPDLRGGILVLEDIHETPQRVDRMLTQLRFAGVLDGVAGIALGQFTDCVPRDPSLSRGLVHDILADHVRALRIPAIAGLPYGHEDLFHPLPVGTAARLTTDPPGLFLLESPGRTQQEEP
jgi:muramoyltetrapeptide carboxypeptidase